MTRRDFLVMLPLLTLPVGGNEWIYPYVHGRDGCGPEDGPMVELYFLEEPLKERGLANNLRIDLRIRGRLDSLIGRVHRLGDPDNPIFSGLAWLGPRVARQLTAAAVRIDQIDGEKLTIGFIEVERVGWQGRAVNLTGVVLPNRTPCG